MPLKSEFEISQEIKFAFVKSWETRVIESIFVYWCWTSLNTTGNTTWDPFLRLKRNLYIWRSTKAWSNNSGLKVFGGNSVVKMAPLRFAALKFVPSIEQSFKIAFLKSASIRIHWLRLAPYLIDSLINFFEKKRSVTKLIRKIFWPLD